MRTTKIKQLFPAPFFFLLIACFLQYRQAAAQEVSQKATGIVRNERGEPIESASVQVKGTPRGSFTDKKGFFSIPATPSEYLVISFIGYDTVTVRAGSGVEAVLHPSTGSLTDAIVIGYGTTKRRDLTGSVAVVSSKDFQTGAITTPEQLIAGKVAGVSVTSNGGSPGSGSVIRIRGIASLNGNQDPLIVVDGLPFSGNTIPGASNALSLVNPNDIESFTVLKDAASTAIYGSRASSGVIIITTKKGHAGRATFNFNTQVSAAKLIKEANVMTTSQFRNYVDSFGTGTASTGVVFKTLLGNSSTDWQKQIYQTAISTDNNLNMSGSIGDKVPFRASVGYLNQQGIVKTDALQRYSANISLTPRFFNDALKVELNLHGAVLQSQFANSGAAISSAVYFDPTQPVHAKSSFGNFFEWTTTDASGNVSLQKLAPRNPLALLDQYDNHATVGRSFGNLALDYLLPWIKGLHANVNLGYDIAHGNGIINVPSFAAQNLLDTGQHNTYKGTMGNSVGEFYLSYIRDFKSIKSSINAVGGYGYYNNLSTTYNMAFVRANGDTAAGTAPLYPKTQQENTLLSYYGRVIYTFDNKYILSGSIREDGSSRFAPNVRWGTFPAGAFTWRVGQEDFLKTSRTVSNLNLRVSYGVTGNQDGIGNYGYLPVYGLSDNTSQVQFGNTFYNTASPAAYDQKVKWEQTANWNAGVDYGFLGNRISGAIDVYYKKTTDLLNQVTLNAGTDFASQLTVNVGDMTNKGVEFIINASPVKSRDWNWNVSYNIAYNTNKITKLTAATDSSFQGNVQTNGIQINSVGYNAYAFYVYHQEYDKNGKPIEGVFQDVNNDGVINTSDLYRYKSPFPKVIMGFSTDVSYKKWTVATVLRVNLGNYMYNGVSTNAIKANILNPLGYLANTFKDVLSTNFQYSDPLSDYYVQNASFLKMDNLSLSYNAGHVFHNDANLRITANCQNVFTVTKYTGQDPELYGGVDNTFYPRPRTYVLGLNLQF